MELYVEDEVFSNLVNECNPESLNSLADVTPVMEDYQKCSGCHVAICQNKSDKVRVYKCAEHINCVFKVHVGGRQMNGKLVIMQNSVLRHTKVCCPSRAIDGRQRKQWRTVKVKEYVEEAAKTKVRLPTDGDVRIGSLKGDPIPHFAAYRAVWQDLRMSKHWAIEGYQHMIPYLQRVLKGHQASVIELETN